MLTIKAPISLLTEDECLSFLKKVRWPNGRYTCPKCGHSGTWLKKKKAMQCGSCRTQTSVTAGSIFHAAKVPTSKLLVILMEVISGITKPTLEVQKDHDIAYSTAWSWLQKIRQFILDNFFLAADSAEIDCGKIAAVLFRRSCESEPKDQSTEQLTVEEQLPPAPPLPQEPSDDDDPNVKTVTGFIADNFQGVSRKHVQAYVAHCFIALNQRLFGLETVIRAFMNSRPLTNKMIGAYSSPQVIRLPLTKKGAS